MTTPSFQPNPRAWSRRDLLRRGAYTAGGLAVLGSAGSFLTACGSDESSDASTGSGSDAAKSLGTAALQLGWVKNVQFGGSFIADSAGYYKDAGISVDLLAGGPTTVVEPVVNSGKALLGIAGGETVVTAIDKGAKLTIIAAGWQKSPVCIISLDGTKIETPQDMIGKKIGVPAASSVSFAAFEKANNIDPASVTVVPVQFDPSPLTNGEVDGYLGYSTNEPTVLELEGHEVHVMMFEDFGLPALSQLYIARDEDLADDKERAKIIALMTGEIRGWQDAVVDFKLAADLAVNTYGKDLGLSLEEQTIEAEVQSKLIVTPDTEEHGLMWMTEEKIDETVKSFELSQLPGRTEMFDATFLKDVYQGATTL